MNDTKHTPGPWFAIMNPAWAKLADIRTESGGAIAFCQTLKESDARLIAAAPDLLHALEMVRDADDDCKKDKLPTMPPIPRRAIDAAIAKATGEQP